MALLVLDCGSWVPSAQALPSMRFATAYISPRARVSAISRTQAL